MSQAAVKRAIVMTAEYYSRQLSEQVLELYAEDLADLDPAAVCAGYTQYRRNPTNRTSPLPAQIRELVAPEQYVAVETQAREIAARIMGAIPKYGWCNAREAETFIGPEGWALVLRAGGWRYLCENTTTKQAPIMQAQFRDQLEGSLRYGHTAIEQSIGALPTKAIAQNALESAGDVIKRLAIARGPEGEG